MITSNPRRAGRAEEVVLVDEGDRELGPAGKLAAHEAGGSLHRAFSVFVFDAGGRLLLQRRAEGKYHFGGLWTNTCCGHPRPGETVEAAAGRRLFEEMGLSLELTPVTSFVYEASDPESGLTEREYDHVLRGLYDDRVGVPDPDPAEVSDWAWISREELSRYLAENPGTFTPWFPLAVAQLYGEGI
ncbi:isopentenyl-diphosphate Delta-isomerase [Rubrobacter aplysinae]|uniref:isopentenyl-diphosphate Delta-isomerase n=1 Tax=Rubrobacter aplysinae TaxID=909625 RepID=UPI00064B9478|nr:isopentenyl-diphosphate Delta-isomerase [Rubrobacter aplysinae]